MEVTKIGPNWAGFSEYYGGTSATAFQETDWQTEFIIGAAYGHRSPNSAAGSDLLPSAVCP
jgi:hypothetical protein